MSLYISELFEKMFSLLNNMQICTLTVSYVPYNELLYYSYMKSHTLTYGRKFKTLSVNISYKTRISKNRISYIITIERSIVNIEY